jgi:hypothetical protein
LDRIAEERGSYPERIRTDNGPEFAGSTMAAWAEELRDGRACSGDFFRADFKAEPAKNGGKKDNNRSPDCFAGKRIFSFGQKRHVRLLFQCAL